MRVGGDVGVELAYEERGSGSAILFLHGVGSDRTAWRPQLAAFGDGFRCVAVDCRGHGESAAPAELIGIPRFAADAAELIERLGLGTAHVCGLSMGGIVALQMWADRPELVRSLILADCWAYHPAAAAGLPERLRAIDSTPLPELARSRMPAVLAPGADPELLARVIEVMAAKDPACYRRSNEVLWGADMRRVAATVRVPALVLVGELDRITPPVLSEELAGLLPGARLEVISGAGHLSNEERPAEFNRAVRRFVDPTPSSPRNSGWRKVAG
jgi:3-oxoadipate enol-lactonase